MSTKLRTHGKGVVVWILLGVMVLGLGGFGIGSFSSGNQKIGSVGETDVSVRDYGRALQTAINQTGQQLGRQLTMTDAKSYGIDQQVQSQIFAQAALTEEARRLGLSVGDAEVARQITQAPAFQNAAGKFDRDAYRMVLKQQGYTESEFENQLRSDVARNMLQGSIASGAQAPAVLVDTYIKYITEARPISWAEVTDLDLTKSVGKPTDEALKAYYDAHTGDFTKPESREITYAWLTPDHLKDKLTPDEAALRTLYNTRSDEFHQPEHRLVDKLVFPNDDDAKQARAELDAGKITFEDLAKQRGLSIQDIDLGEVTKAELGAAGDGVFALTEPGVVGPVTTNLGPALFKMNGIIAAEDTSFEQAKPDLEAEATLEAARQQINKMSAEVEDKLASGLSLEDLAKETGMELGHISMTTTTRDGIAAYQEFRDAAAAVTPTDFPELKTMNDGGIFALQLDGTTKAAPIPFDEVKDKVAAAWTDAELTKLKTERADAIVTAVNGGKTLSDEGVLVTNSPAVERTGFIEGAPTALIGKAFDIDAGKAATVTDGDHVYVLMAGAPVPADPNAAETVQLRGALDNRLAQSIANDLVTLYAISAQNTLGLQIDSATISAVQSQIQ